MSENISGVKLDEEIIRIGWEAVAGDIRDDLLTGRISGKKSGKRFNPRSIEKVIKNFIESMVFAGIPCTREKAVVAMFNAYSTSKVTKFQRWPR